MILHELFEEIKVGDYRLSNIDSRNYDRLVNMLTKNAENIQSAIDTFVHYNHTDNAIISKFISEIEDNKSLVEKKIDELRKNDKTIKPITNNLNRMFKVLESQCSDIINTYKDTGKVFYRGMKRTISKNGVATFIHGKSPINRKPRDSSESISHAVNSMLMAGGVKARRDNSIFVTSNVNRASPYIDDSGTIYIIFPVNGFNYSWTKHVDLILRDENDLGPLLDKSLIMKAYQILKSEFNNISNKNLPGYPILNVIFNEWSIDDFCMQFISARSSIMRIIKEGTFPESMNQYVSDLTQYMTPRSTIEGLELKTDDINVSLQLRKEVCISGEYYAIDYKYKADIDSWLANYNGGSE